MVDKALQHYILTHTQSIYINNVELVQELWSGYGQILRVQLKGGQYSSVIIKKIQFPSKNSHPRGWNTSFSHERKVKSYAVEKEWYLNWNYTTNTYCRTANCIHIGNYFSNEIIILEDLNESTFSKRKTDLTLNELKLCLKWLANFHAINLHKKPKNLWNNGTYWHLATRPDELGKMVESELKDKAELIDQKLNNCTFKTIIHGDSKVANFCFSDDLKDVSAVDFQYVGAGCGMKDIIYLMSSCLTEKDCQNLEGEVLSSYFSYLKEALLNLNISINFDELKNEWTMLYPFAWADFARFLQGWSPSHYKLNGYSLQQVNKTLKLV